MLRVPSLLSTYRYQSPNYRVFLRKDHSKSQDSQLSCPSNEAYAHVQNMAIGSDKAETLCIDSTVVNTLDV